MTDRAAGGVSAPWRLTLGVLARIPTGLVSRVAGALADVPLPGPARAPALRLLSRWVGIDATEAELPFAGYRTVNEFFVRRLRDGARAWPVDAGLLLSPVDGIVGEVGTLSADRALQAKGLSYRLSDLLGPGGDGAHFEGGRFLTLYLSPRHYHRIHAPSAGRLHTARHVPGRLLPVNRPAVLRVPELFARNERLVVSMDTVMGPITVVAVGAFNVGRISSAFDRAWAGRDGGWITNRGSAPPALRRYDPPLGVSAGQELMAFHLGSSVIVLTGPGLVLDARARSGTEVRTGEILARTASSDDLLADP